MSSWVRNELGQVQVHVAYLGQKILWPGTGILVFASLEISWRLKEKVIIVTFFSRNKIVNKSFKHFSRSLYIALCILTQLIYLLNLTQLDTYGSGSTNSNQVYGWDHSNQREYMKTAYQSVRKKENLGWWSSIEVGISK